MSLTSFAQNATTVLRVILHRPYRRLLDGVPLVLPMCFRARRAPSATRRTLGCVRALSDPELSRCPSTVWPVSAAWEEEVRWALNGEAKAKATREQAVKGAEEAAREVAEKERDATIAAARAR
jgi:hypothetical protein